MKYKDFLTTAKECPFCEKKQNIILETDKSYLTYAIAPYSRHHLLIVPKRHVESISDMDASEIIDIDALQLKGIELLKKLSHVNFALLEREGNISNRSVRHVHFHIIPDVRVGDLDHDPDHRDILTPEEGQEIVDEIKQVIE